MIIRAMTIEDYDEVFAMWQITSKRALSSADERSQMEREKTHIFCYQNNETGQKFWSDFGFVKRDDVFVFSY